MIITCVVFLAGFWFPCNQMKHSPLKCSSIQCCISFYGVFRQYKRCKSKPLRFIKIEWSLFHRKSKAWITYFDSAWMFVDREVNFSQRTIRFKERLQFFFSYSVRKIPNKNPSGFCNSFFFLHISFLLYPSFLFSRCFISFNRLEFVLVLCYADSVAICKIENSAVLDI